MQKIKPTTEQLKIRFDAEYQFFRELKDEQKSMLFHMVWGWMESEADWNVVGAETFIKAVETLQRDHYPVVLTEKHYKVAQEVAEAIDGLQKAEA